MIKVKDLIKELRAENPGMRVWRTVRTVCLPRHGYAPWARWISKQDAMEMRMMIALAAYLIKIEEAFGKVG